MKKTILSAIVALLACSTASAQIEQEKVRTIKVHYTDLDLSTQLGQEKFKKRLLRAVDNVCRHPIVQTAAQGVDEQRCRTRAKTTAMRQAGQTIARYGGSVKVALD